MRFLQGFLLGRTELAPEQAERHFVRFYSLSATATRDLVELLEIGCLEKLPGGGRSTRYGVRLENNKGDA